MSKKIIKNNLLKLLTIFVYVLLIIFLTFELIQNFQLKKYVNLVNKTYKIPTGQSTKSAIPGNFKFTHQDAFGITLVDIADLLNNKYLVDPNHEELFYWLDSKGKEVDLSSKSDYVYIGIPLKTEDIGKDNVENIPYINRVYQDLSSALI